MFFPDCKERFEAILRACEGKKIAVLGHMRPDGDCIGSQIAMCRILRSRGIDTICANNHNVPANLRDFVEDTPFFCGNDFRGNAQNREIVTVDCSALLRVGEKFVAENFENPQIFAAIDHHESSQISAKIDAIVVPAAAATCFLLAGMVFDCGIKIDLCTARALYAGIVTDSGNFQYPSTTAAVFEVASRLIALGVRPAEISHRIYEQEKFAKLALLQRFLATAQLRSRGEIAVGWIPKNAYAETGTSTEDSELFVNYLRNTAGVKIACKIEQTSDGIKGSLRANDERWRVDLLAGTLAKIFGGNGGGHKAAAGFSLKNLDLDADRERVFAEIEAFLREREESVKSEE